MKPVPGSPREHAPDSAPLQARIEESATEIIDRAVAEGLRSGLAAANEGVSLARGRT
jgi:hypothetical protein